VKLFRVPRTGLYGELWMRDEHCPPHLHVENEEVPWEARLAFSFVGDVVRVMDVDPIEDAPNTRTLACMAPTSRLTNTVSVPSRDSRIHRLSRQQVPTLAHHSARHLGRLFTIAALMRSIVGRSTTHRWDR